MRELRKVGTEEERFGKVELQKEVRGEERYGVKKAGIRN